MKISFLLSRGAASTPLAALQASHTVTVTEGRCDQHLAALVDREAPDIAFVEATGFEGPCLEAVEEINRRHPGVAVILLAARQDQELLLRAMRAGVREVLPSPAPAAALVEAVARIEAKLSGARTRSLGQLIAFLPCKGGSGATFLATNLGWMLAERASVLLIDLNLRLGDALAFVHDGEAPHTIADVARHIARLDASLLASSCVRVAPRYSVLAAPHHPAEAMDVSPTDIDALLTVAAANYDFVLLDMDRSLDAVSIRALDRCDRIHPVLQASVGGLRNALKLTELFRAIGYPQARVQAIVNRYDRGGEIDADQVRRAMGGTDVVTVPNAWREANASANRGEPVGLRSPASALAKSIGQLAQALQPSVIAPTGLLGRLFRKPA